MKKRISNLGTQIGQLWIGIMIIAFGYTSIVVLFEDGLEGLMFLLPMTILMLLVKFHIFKLKVCFLDNEFFYAGNVVKQIKVPLSSIKSVTDFPLIEPSIVSVEFYQETEFGSKVKFLATSRFSFFSNHPIVEEIKNARNLSIGKG